MEYTLNVLETGKAKMKLRRAFRYGVSCAVRPGARYFLGVTPYKKGDGVRNTVSLLTGLTVGEVDFTLSMFDKAFATMEVFQDLVWERSTCFHTGRINNSIGCGTEKTGLWTTLYERVAGWSLNP